MNLHIKTSWISNSTDDPDKSGIGIYEFNNQKYSIEFNDFEDYFLINKIITENARLAKDAELVFLKNEITELIQYAIHKN